MTIVEIKKMSTVELFQTMEAIWDSLLHNEVEIESPEWHQDILAERKKKIEKGKGEFISIQTLKAAHEN
ncbi:MAG: addiction module protein [Desulfobacterales bacterium]|nr:addiction module protein [Desulfobacterales bacterium]MBF0396253.1 addiction module protein [Desulfobacterales bacterium]